MSVTYLKDDEILSFSKLKAFVENNFNVAQMGQYFFDIVKYIVEKGENAGFQHFLLFPQCIQKSLKVGIM